MPLLTTYPDSDLDLAFVRLHTVPMPHTDTSSSPVCVSLGPRRAACTAAWTCGGAFCAGPHTELALSKDLVSEPEEQTLRRDMLAATPNMWCWWLQEGPNGTHPSPEKRCPSPTHHSGIYEKPSRKATEGTFT